MIKITIESPTVCYLENASSDQIRSISSYLTYHDTSVAFALEKLEDNKWLKNFKPETFNLRKKELQKKAWTCLLRFCPEKRKHYFHPGSIDYLPKHFKFEILNNVKYPESRKMVWKKPLPFDLYPYQKDSVQRLLKAKHGCVELCTGAGKSAIILALARELGLKTVIITPSKSIFLEILEKFEHHLGKTNVGTYGSGKKKLGKNLTVCISKSLTMIKPGSEEYDFFSSADVVISDESHLNAAETLETVFHGLLKNVPYRFFLSGTQIRGDGKDQLLEAIIGKKVFSLNTKEAIEGGYICPVKFLIFETTSKDIKKYKDPLKAKRNQFLYNENICDIIVKIANSAWKQGQESTLILVEELEQIKMLKNKIKVPFDYVHSASKADASLHGLETKKIDQIVEMFNKGEIKVLIGTSCIATGTNIYPTHNTVNWVGGASEVRTKQGAVGRSVRILEKSKYKDLHKSKPYSKIYDFKILNVSLMKAHFQKRISMYKETSDNIKYIQV